MTAPLSPMAKLQIAFEAKLKESGLTARETSNKKQPSDCTKLGMEVVTAMHMKALKVPEFDGFVIPYFDTNGNKTEFYRVRYLVDTKTGFAKLTNKKSQRYAQAPGTLNEVYMSPMMQWSKVVENTEIPIIITEGELKAACAVKMGIPCVGLGGVWCFKSNAHNMDVLPWFKETKMKKRTVIICYDSDAISNPMVMGAEIALAKELVKLGAVPMIIRLPTLAFQKKSGLDDFLVTRGKDTFMELLNSASPFLSAEQLHLLNTEITYVKDPGVIFKLENLQRMRPADFISHSEYCVRTYKEEIVTEKGSKYEIKFAAKEWIKWPSRGEVSKVIYEPGEDKITSDRCLNVWPGWGAEPTRGDVSHWIRLLDHLFAGEPEARRWFEQWCAYPIQHPGIKMYTSAVMWSRHKGNGKSLVAYTLGRIYGDNFTEIEEQNLYESHNEWAENKQFVLGDEITSGDKRKYADKLKGMITRTKLRLNPKYVPSYEVRDCINYYFTSNHPDAFFLEDGDRRFFIHEIINHALPDEFYDSYDKWFKSAEGASALFGYMLELDTKGFNPRGHAPVTQSKLDMIEGNRSDLDRWCSALIANPDDILRLDKAIIKHKLWRTEDLMGLYDPLERGKVSLNGLGRALRKAGATKAAQGSACRTSWGQCKLWVFRDAEYFDGLMADKIGKYYDEERRMPALDQKDKKYK